MKYRSPGIIGFKLFFLIGMLLPTILAIAQNKTEFAMHVPGKLKRGHQVYKFIQKFRAMPDARAFSLANSANKIQDVVCSLPQLNPPLGFNVENGVATDGAELKSKEPFLKVFWYLRYLENDEHTGKITTSMDGADLYLDINAFDLFHQIGNYWEDCNKIKFPLFFEALPITDSTADYIQTSIKGKIIRMVTTDKPLFIPLTRKEFLQFLIARDNYRIKENQDLISDEKKQIADTKKNSTDPVYQPVKSSLEKAMGTMEGQIKKLNEEIGSLKQKIAHFQETMNTMSVEEAGAAARLDYNKKSDELFGLEQLMPAGDKTGVLLTRVNPGYYNYSSNAPAAQLVTIYYSWPSVGYEKDPDYLQQAVLDIFRQLDYHALKMSLR